MNPIFHEMALGGLLFFVVTLSCCSQDSISPQATRITAEESRGVIETNEKDIVSLILSLPKFRYHEESRSDFEKRLSEAQMLPRNRRAHSHHLYCPSDGTFPAREFIWNQNTDSMTVKVYGDGVDSLRIDKWKRVQGGWKEQ